MKCYAWERSLDRLREFQGILPQLGDKELNTWAADYAMGQGADRIFWDVAYLKANHTFSTCLNVGGAPYIFEYFARQMLPTVTLQTIDLDVSRFPRAQYVLGMQLHQVNIENPGTELRKLGQFQCVVFGEIIEHLRIDLIRTMTTVWSLLSDDGILYLTTPNGTSLAGWRRFLFQDRTGPPLVAEWSKLSLLGHMGHVREYSLREICELLEHCNFAVESVFYRFGLRRSASLRAVLCNALQRILTTIFPGLGNEIVIIARRRPHSPTE